MKYDTWRTHLKLTSWSVNSFLHSWFLKNTVTGQFLSGNYARSSRNFKITKYSKVFPLRTFFVNKHERFFRQKKRGQVMFGEIISWTTFRPSIINNMYFVILELCQTSKILNFSIFSGKIVFSTYKGKTNEMLMSKMISTTPLAL